MALTLLQSISPDELMETTTLFTLTFATAIALTTALRLWLTLRQIAHVRQHRDAVPANFAESISPEEHRKAADYTIAKAHLGIVQLAAGTVLLLVLVFAGGLQAIDALVQKFFAAASTPHGLALFAGFALVGWLVELPFDLYRTFTLEARFGFNRMTWAMYLADTGKGALVAIVIGTPLLLAVLWLMAAMGSLWWFWVWLFWLSFNLLAMMLYPTLIAPLFNKFVPLADAALRERIEALLLRCGFRVSGLFVMDGSKRSSHGNAYFTGMGRNKRIVFFDTLLARLSTEEIEAVLAHELGHFRRHHVWKRLGMLAVASLGFLWLLGQLIVQPWFYAGLGVATPSPAMALILFSLVLPVFAFPLAPLTSALSRRHEYEADAYAAQQTRASDLVTALVKLYRDNAATLTPDPLHSQFYDSHPPAVLRIARLQAA
jgi:STE24 endopeptidase